MALTSVGQVLEVLWRAMLFNSVIILSHFSPAYKKPTDTHVTLKKRVTQVLHNYLKVECNSKKKLTGLLLGHCTHGQVEHWMLLSLSFIVIVVHTVAMAHFSTFDKTNHSRNVFQIMNTFLPFHDQGLSPRTIPTCFFLISSSSVLNYSQLRGPSKNSVFLRCEMSLCENYVMSHVAYFTKRGTQCVCMCVFTCL